MTTKENMLQTLSSLIKSKQKKDRPLIVGITGIDTSGKTQLTEDLYNYFQKSKQDTQIVHVDDFHNPKSLRYNSALSEADQYYSLSININKLVNKVLKPIKEQGQLHCTLTHLDLLTDRMTLQRTYNVTSNTIVLLEGIFLLRPELYSFLDLSIFLAISEDIAIERANIRDVPLQGKEVIGKYHTKYLPAQRTYLSKYRPDLLADVIIDNSNWHQPAIIHWSQKMKEPMYAEQTY
ncbi:hypothetical protein JYA63_07100 [Fictibacillus nanhaiensis]|uniref:Phosphoribulokinase/uridine kinase domain-containing protein n=1 Tax=Fictibacillus nanhaiensis TaxID=742169 RepID=A0ABS2ZNS0_9BACL|nr:hypothetical protein [Fictibacillus nanhaiensis]